MIKREKKGAAVPVAVNDVEDVDTFDYFNSDVKLLVLLILLEGYHRGQNVFTLDQFLKGNYWKIDEISEEIRDTNDSGSVEDMVLHQVLGITEGLDLGKTRRISVKNISGLLELAVKKAVMTESPTDDDVGYYQFVISEIYDMKKLCDTKIENEIKEHPGNAEIREMINSLTFDTESEAFRHLNFMSSIAASHLEVEIRFIDDVAKEMDKTIEGYLSSFAKDDFFDRKPDYRKKRLYFSKQLENFYNYIKGLPVIDGSINIPFSSLEEQGFEVVKILSYLEMKKRIKVRNWNDVDMWNVKFYVTPITLQSLTSGGIESKSEGDFKGNLSFDEAKSILHIGDKPVKIRNKSDQYHLLRIMFEDKNDIAKEWFYSEIAEKYDDEAQFDDKKFYNAAYQVKQKIIRDTGLQDVLLTTNQSVRINPKYLNKT